MALYSSYNNNATSCNTPSKSGSAICGSDQYTCCLGKDNTPPSKSDSASCGSDQYNCCLGEDDQFGDILYWVNNLSSGSCKDNNTTRSDQCTINTTVLGTTRNIVNDCKADRRGNPTLKPTKSTKTLWFNNFGRSSTPCKDNNTTRSDQCTINTKVHQSTGNIVDDCKADGMDPPILKSTPPWSPPDDQCWEENTPTAPLCLQNKCCYGCTSTLPYIPGRCQGPSDDACPHIASAYSKPQQEEICNCDGCVFNSGISNYCSIPGKKEGQSCNGSNDNCLNSECHRIDDDGPL